MRIRWVKVWVDSLATLTERFRDEEGRVDFDALGREEYAFRHALVTGDFSRSERARDLYDATINEITSRSEAGRKGAESRWSRNTAAAPHREAGDVSANGCNPLTADGDIREDSQAIPDGSAITRNETRDHDALEPSANLYAAAATRDGVDVIPTRESGLLERTTGCNNSQVAPTRKAGDESSDASNGAALKSATACNHYDQEALDKPTISANSPAGAGVNFDSTQPIKRPDASSGNAEGVILTGSPIFLNCSGNGSRAACTSATSGQTFEALDKPGAGEVPPESVSAKPSPALPVPAKKAHGEFGNVMLTDDEFAKLQEKTPNAWDLITELDQYIESQGKTKKYKSHYATLLNWSRRKAQEAKPKQGFKTAAEKQRDELQKIADYYASKEVVG